MTFEAFDVWWWPYLFILVAGWLATDIWRYIGVYLGDRISAESDLLVLVRCVATALVAAVIGNLVLFPGGALADTPVVLRVGAVATGFAVYLLVKRSIPLSIVVTEGVLLAGLYAMP